MNLLILHSAYNNSSPSGENQVVENEIRLLRDEGHTIFSPELSASKINKSWIRNLLKNFFLRKILPSWSYTRASKKYLLGNRIQLIHCHNIFPLVDFSILEAAYQLDIPVVFSIHNYRFLCLNGLFYRDSQVCTLCIESNSFGKKYKCYKNSRILSTLAANSQASYLNYLKRASRILVLNTIAKNMLIDQGIAGEKILLKRNFTVDRYNSNLDEEIVNKDILWVGRIDESKGLAHLIDAWTLSNLPQLGYKLKVVGDGPLRKNLEFKGLSNSSITFLGSASRSELDAMYSRCSFLLVSSRWLEGFPMVIVEAAMHNLKVLAPKFGSFLDLESEKWVLLVGTEMGDWVEAINQIPNLSSTSNSRNWYLKNCTEQAVVSKLISLYKELIS
jgi:glycosyltransferase involved in cell wall biosynthesis